MVASGKKLSEGLRTSCSSTITTPAMTRACAFVRDCASPRSTSSLSMRSRFIAGHFTPKRRARRHRYLPARALHHRAGRIADVQLGGAVDAQPHHNSRRINPKERTNLAGDLHGVFRGKPLQRLHKKHSVVEIAFCPLVSMDAFTFKKKLLLHIEADPSLAPHRASFD